MIGRLSHVRGKVTFSLMMFEFGWILCSHISCIQTCQHASEETESNLFLLVSKNFEDNAFLHDVVEGARKVWCEVYPSARWHSESKPRVDKGIKSKTKGCKHINSAGKFMSKQRASVRESMASTACGSGEMLSESDTHSNETANTWTLRHDQEMSFFIKEGTAAQAARCGSEGMPSS